MLVKTIKQKADALSELFGIRILQQDMMSKSTISLLQQVNLTLTQTASNTQNLLIENKHLSK